MIQVIIGIILLVAFGLSLYYEFKNSGDASTPDEDGSKNNTNQL